MIFLLAILQVEVMVPMRDGVKLATDVYVAEGARKLPVILVRTPYGKSADKGTGRYFSAHG